MPSQSLPGKGIAIGVGWYLAVDGGFVGNSFGGGVYFFSRCRLIDLCQLAGGGAFGWHLSGLHQDVVVAIVIFVVVVFIFVKDATGNGFLSCTGNTGGVFNACKDLHSGL